MKHVRKRLTYANVMSSIAVFLVLGGVAVAVSVPRKSVGTKQLKPSAVTAAKIHKNAVTNAKIKNGAVESRKVADGSLASTDLDIENMPFGRVVARLRSTGSLSLKAEKENKEVLPFALNPATYVQAPNEVDSYYGAVDVTFQPTCTPPRQASAIAMVDAPKPTELALEPLVGFGFVEDSTSGTVNKRIDVAPLVFEGSGMRFEPGTAKTHTVSLVVTGKCNEGTGITATFGGVDVVGVR